MSLIDTLAPLRAHGGMRTTGLDDATLLAFADRDPQLAEAISAAAEAYAAVRAEFPALLDMEEDAQRAEVEDLDHVGVLQRDGELGLLEEEADEDGVLAEVRQDALHG